MTSIDEPSGNSGEVTKVKLLLPRFIGAVKGLGTEEVEVEAIAGFKLPYAHEIMGYELDTLKAKDDKSPPYQTDLLIRDVNRKASSWVPRVVIEFKFGSITTHDALTYSAKAFTHKHVHPYLRYGTVVGGFWNIPPRLIRHGAYFDFMAVWENSDPSPKEWRDIGDIIASEVRASRRLQQLLSGSVQCRRLYKGVDFDMLPQ